MSKTLIQKMGMDYVILPKARITHPASINNPIQRHLVYNPFSKQNDELVILTWRYLDEPFDYFGRGTLGGRPVVITTAEDGDIVAVFEDKALIV